MKSWRSKKTGESGAGGVGAWGAGLLQYPVHVPSCSLEAAHDFEEETKVDSCCI